MLPPIFSPIWQIRKLSVEGGRKENMKIPAYSGLCERQIFLHFFYFFISHGQTPKAGHTIATSGYMVTGFHPLTFK